MNDTQRPGDWIQTYTGLQFWPLDPRPDEIAIEDIAHALSLICRFTGHCREFYSVAQHSVLASIWSDNPREALLHDASEAYICDIARPVKRFIPGYKEIEARVEKVIAERFGLTWPWPDEVKVVDDRLLATEARDIVGDPVKCTYASWCLPYPPFGFRIEPWDSKTAEREFTKRFYDLFDAETVTVSKPRTERCVRCGIMTADWVDPDGAPGRLCRECETAHITDPAA